VPDLLALRLAERLAPLGKERVGLLDAHRAQVEADPAFQVVAEEVARLDDSRSVEPDVRLRLVLLELVDVVARGELVDRHANAELPPDALDDGRNLLVDRV